MVDEFGEMQVDKLQVKTKSNVKFAHGDIWKYYESTYSIKVFEELKALLDD